MEEEGMRITVVGVVLNYRCRGSLSRLSSAPSIRTTIADHGRIKRADKSKSLKRNG